MCIGKLTVSLSLMFVDSFCFPFLSKNVTYMDMTWIKRFASYSGQRNAKCACLRVPLDSSEGWQGERQENGGNAARTVSKTTGEEDGVSVPWTWTRDTIQGGQKKFLKEKLEFGFYIRAKILRKFASRKSCWNSVIPNVMVRRSVWSGYLILGSVDSETCWGIS